MMTLGRCEDGVVSILRLSIIVLCWHLSNWMATKGDELYVSKTDTTLHFNASTILFNEEITDFTYDFYNFYRRAGYYGMVQGQPKAKHMPYVRWEEWVAEKARVESAKCWRTFNNTAWTSNVIDSSIYGRSIYVVNASRNVNVDGINVNNVTLMNRSIKSIIAQACKTWFDQNQYFIYPNQCHAPGACSDYHQMVSEKTLNFGCGLTLCHMTKNDGSTDVNTSSSSSSSLEPQERVTSSASNVSITHIHKASASTSTSNSSANLTSSPRRISTSNSRQPNLFFNTEPSAYFFVCIFYPKADDIPYVADAV